MLLSGNVVCSDLIRKASATRDISCVEWKWFNFLTQLPYGSVAWIILFRIWANLKAKYKRAESRNAKFETTRSIAFIQNTELILIPNLLLIAWVNLNFLICKCSYYILWQTPSWMLRFVRLLSPFSTFTPFTTSLAWFTLPASSFLVACHAARSSLRPRLTSPPATYWWAPVSQV
jgi:hypothetical protein